DLDLAGGHASPFGSFGKPACEECLARPVLATDGLEHRPATGDSPQLVVEGCVEALQTDREQVQPGVPDGGPAQRGDHPTAPDGTDRPGQRFPSRSNWLRSISRFSSKV